MSIPEPRSGLPRAFVLRAKRLSLPASAVAGLVVAEAAVWLLRPHGLVEPASVPESRYFSADQLERAREFAAGQRLLGLAAIAVQGSLLVAAVVRPPRRGLALAERLARGRPLIAGAAVGAGLVTAIALAPLPLRALARERALDVGLSTQGWASWALDAVKEIGVSAALATAGAALFLGLMRRSPRRWWLGGAVAVVGIELLFVWLAPVVLAPLFNRFEELPQGRLRSEVIALARNADVDVGEVFVVDASRRTSGTNAFVAGLGHTKRVVLYDNLIDRFTPAQVRLVVAHELAHVKNRDLFRGMLWVALVAPLGMFTVKRLTDRWAPRGGAAGSPASVPALVLALALVSFVGGVVSNQLSRPVEQRADEFALRLTEEPDQYIRMERKLALSNVSDADPPRLFLWLFGTHPSPIERIGTAVAFERDRAISGR